MMTGKLCSETNFDILLPFCVFYDTSNLTFVRSTENQSQNISWKVAKPFVNFRTQLSHEYLSLYFN